MNKILVVAAVSEIATGVALLILPSIVGRLLLGVELTGIAIPIARVAGIALLALGLACWPRRQRTESDSPAFRGMLIYNVLIALYLAYLGIDGQWVGSLLWPVVAIHAGLTFFLARAWRRADGEAKKIVGQLSV
ncbi:MAG TPA: hypothetical protein VF077_02210 [Nitrospiraceae bacterium]